MQLKTENGAGESQKPRCRVFQMLPVGDSGGGWCEPQPLLMAPQTVSRRAAPQEGTEGQSRVSSR